VLSTHQDRLVKVLALAGITEMEEANKYLAETYLPTYNAEFTQPPPEEGSAFVKYRDLSVLDDILCERFERTVRKDNCVHLEGLVLQIPEDRHRCHYVKAKVKVLRYTDNTLAIHHGPRELARYDAQGQEIPNELPVAA